MAEGERKLAAILSADVAGYGRLMADDEAATVRTLTDYREVFRDHIARHRGRVIDTAGDSVLAVFDSPVEAVESAADAQRELRRRNRQLVEHRRMEFRIGVNLGDIILRDDGTIYGDGVNVAARLQSLAEPGGVMISHAVHMQVEGKLDIAFEDAGEHEVKNIPKPVLTYRKMTEWEPAAVAAQPESKIFQPSPVLLAVLGALIVIVAGAAIWQATRAPHETESAEARSAQDDAPNLAMPTGPSIAVMPFENMSGDPEQEYFADGIVEGMISRLARFRSLRVIARNSTFKFKDQAVDVRDVGRELGVEYVLEGSVQRDANIIRISTQLLNANDGAHLWAQTYDRDLSAGNIFSIQDDIMERVVGIIGGPTGAMIRAEMASIKQRQTDNFEVFDCVLLAYAYQYVVTVEKHVRARTCLEKAVQIDPLYADAWVQLAMVYLAEFKFDHDRQPGNPLDRALEAALQAIELDPTHESAHEYLAEIYYFQREFELFLMEAERAIELNPNDALLVANLAVWIGYAGQWDRGLALTERALALNPNGPGWFHWLPYLNHYRKHEYQEALKHAQRINMPGFYLTHIALSTSYAQLGRISEAKSSLADMLAIKPDFSATARDTFERRNLAPDLVDHLLEGLRKAGLSIPDEPAAAE